MAQLTFELLKRQIADGAVAVRRAQRLLPAGGDGDKVFPPTYEGGVYALVERVIDGRRVPCVLLDSVQSQANRIELALKEAFYRGRSAEAQIPVVTVDFGAVGLPEVGEITSLDAPHRVADAIFRDSLLGDQRFRESVEGRVLDLAGVSNATGLFGLCPVALVLGLWDSTGPRGGLGVKFQRAIVSEIIGVDVQTGVRPSSRIDPLGIERNAAEIYVSAANDTDWTLDAAKAKREKDVAVKVGKKREGRPSEINHGNVTPSLVKNERGDYVQGGVSLAYAQQMTVLSLPALRRLRFPTEDGEITAERNLVAQAALASLAIAGAQLSTALGCDLRSRCLLVPDPSATAGWELIGADGVASVAAACSPANLLADAAAAAAQVGLPAWVRRPIVLQPRPEFAQLVRQSRSLSAAATTEG